MPKICSVCEHPQRAEIDFRLLSGEATRATSERFGLTYPTVKGHRRSAHHLQQTPRRGTTGTHTADTLLTRIVDRLGDDAAIKDLRIAASMLPPEEKRVLVAALRSRAGRGKVAEPERRVA